MAKRKRRPGKQGVVSWVRAIIALWIAFFRPISLLFAGETSAFMSEASMGFSDGAFDKGAALRMYGPMIGGMLFYKVSGELTNRIRLRTLVPALPG